MRFFLDANMPRSTLQLLRDHGHEAELARDLGMASATDDEIWLYAKQTQSTLITRDFDFADLRSYKPNEIGGCVVLTLPDSATAALITSLIAELISNVDVLHSIAHRLAIIEPGRIRVRDPLPREREQDGGDA